jgi:hypothetical protein
VRVRGGKRDSKDAQHDDGSRPPPDDRESAPAVGSTRSPTRDAVKIAVAGAIATVVTTALLSGAWSSVAGWFGGDDSSSAREAGETSTTGSPPPTPSPSSTAPTMKDFTSGDNAIKLRVPETWGHVRSGWNLDFDEQIDPGSGLRAGVDDGVSSSKNYATDTYYLGASSAAAERLGLHGRDEVDLRDYLTTLVRHLDWTLDGCVLDEEGELDVDGYVVVFRKWSACAGFSHMTMWDVFGVSRSGDVLMSAQLQSGTTPVELQREMLTDWLVRPEALPSGSTRKVKARFEFPTPAWYGGDID